MQKELDKSVGQDKTSVTTKADKTLNVMFYDTKHCYNVNEGTVAKTELVPTLSVPWLYGDVDLDGDVDEDDVALVHQAYVNPIQLNGFAKIQADVTGDGKVRMRDVNVLSDYISGQITTFPAYENATALNSYDETSNSFKLIIKAEDKNFGLSKIIWYYKKSSEENYISKEETIENTKEAKILETEITGLTGGTYEAYAEVYNAEGNKAESNKVTITIE